MNTNIINGISIKREKTSLPASDNTILLSPKKKKIYRRKQRIRIVNFLLLLKIRKLNTRPKIEIKARGNIEKLKCSTKKKNFSIIFVKAETLLFPTVNLNVP